MKSQHALPGRVSAASVTNQRNVNFRSHQKGEEDLNLYVRVTKSQPVVVPGVAGDQNVF
jgi:hypothetical protein